MRISSKRHLVGSKLKKTKALQKNKRLASHIPRTKRLNKKTLIKMLRRHKMVYLKPVNGSKGRGIMRVEKKKRRYKLRKGTSSIVFKNAKTLYKSVRRMARKPYLVQRGIRTLLFQGRSFDFRIMLQKNESSKWEVTGIVGRVAPPKKIVTNRSQGGKCLSAKRLLMANMNRSKVKPYLNSLYRLSRNIGEQLHSVYPGVLNLGIDIAVSRQLKPWILEVNTNPAVTPFINLGNRQMLKRIGQLIRLNYGRK